MKLNVTQKILVGYVLGFILLLAFSSLTLLNGKKIEATAVALSQEKISGLVAVASLKSHVQAQSNQLYALYATNDQATFATQHEATMAAQLLDIANADASRTLTEQLINIALILAGLTFLGVLAMAYYSHRQVAVPLREISNTLTGIAARKDLTQRIRQRSDDEIGAITMATNNLLEEFQKLARTLDGTAQEVNRTAKSLTDITENTRLNMADKNTKLRLATQQFMADIEASAKDKTKAIEVDIELHRAQMKFIQLHLNEIDDTKQTSDQNVTALQTSTGKLQKLAENMQGQIRLLNF